MKRTIVSALLLAFGLVNMVWVGGSATFPTPAYAQAAPTPTPAPREWLCGWPFRPPCPPDPTPTPAAKPQPPTATPTAVPTGNAPRIMTTALPQGHANVLYETQVVATAGLSPFRWDATGLPVGLTIDSTNGLIRGTPNSAYNLTIQVRVTDQLGRTDTAAYQLLINPAAPAATNTPTPAPSSTATPTATPVPPTATATPTSKPAAAPPSTGLTADDVRRIFAEELAKIFGRNPPAAPPSAAPAPPSASSPSGDKGPSAAPARPSGNHPVITTQVAMVWCQPFRGINNCADGRWQPLEEANGVVNPRGIKLETGDPVRLVIPAGVTGQYWDCFNGHSFQGPTTLEQVCEASLRANSSYQTGSPGTSQPATATPAPAALPANDLTVDQVLALDSRLNGRLELQTDGGDPRVKMHSGTCLTNVSLPDGIKVDNWDGKVATTVSGPAVVTRMCEATWRRRNK